MKNVIYCLAVAALATTPVLATPVDLAKTSGIQGGIIVHLGCGDGKETGGLLLNDRTLVHGLDTDRAKVTTARKVLQAAGVYGKVSVATFDGRNLPYTNDLINLVIDSTGGTVAHSEIMRVLVPGGVAYIGGKKVVKPRATDIDEWTHYLHGPDNNAVAADKRVDIVGLGSQVGPQPRADGQHVRNRDRRWTFSSSTASCGWARTSRGTT